MRWSISPKWFLAGATLRGRGRASVMPNVIGVRSFFNEKRPDTNNPPIHNVPLEPHDNPVDDHASPANRQGGVRPSRLGGDVRKRQPPGRHNPASRGGRFNKAGGTVRDVVSTPDTLINRYGHPRYAEVVFGR